TPRKDDNEIRLTSFMSPFHFNATCAYKSPVVSRTYRCRTNLFSSYNATQHKPNEVSAKAKLKTRMPTPMKPGIKKKYEPPKITSPESPKKPLVAFMETKKRKRELCGQEFSWSPEERIPKKTKRVKWRDGYNRSEEVLDQFAELGEPLLVEDIRK